MSAEQLLIFIAPVILSIIAFDYYYTAKVKKIRYTLFGFIQNINQTLGQQVINVFLRASFIGLYYILHSHLALYTIETSALTVLAIFLVVDFCQYWFHRLCHSYHFMWAMHLVHHSSHEMNISVSLRNPWFNQIYAFIIYVPLAILGFEPKTVIMVVTINYIFQFWVHSAIIGKLGILEKIIITPSTHRVHHSNLPHHLDKNFGNTLVIWDRMFGTYLEESDEVVYGTTLNANTANPLWENLYYFKYMLELAKTQKGLANKLKILTLRLSKIPQGVTRAEARDILYKASKSLPSGPITYTNSHAASIWALFLLTVISLAAFLSFAPKIEMTGKVLGALGIFILLYLQGLNLKRGKMA